MDKCGSLHGLGLFSCLHHVLRRVMSAKDGKKNNKSGRRADRGPAVVSLSRCWW